VLLVRSGRPEGNNLSSNFDEKTETSKITAALGYRYEHVSLGGIPYQVTAFLIEHIGLPRRGKRRYNQRQCDHSFLDTLPARLIGEKAYDSDPLDPIWPSAMASRWPRPMRRTPGANPGRSPVGRYRRRWRVKRLFAWLHRFRRLVIRWEYHVESSSAWFVSVAYKSAQAIMRRLLVPQRHHGIDLGRVPSW
jgi:hypothetical protein